MSFQSPAENMTNATWIWRSLRGHALAAPSSRPRRASKDKAFPVGSKSRKNPIRRSSASWPFTASGFRFWNETSQTRSSTE